MTTFYMLVGLPGTGKSTWTDRFKRRHRDDLVFEGIKNNTAFNWNLSVISTDDIIQHIANEHRLTYNDVFDNITYSFAEKMTHKLAKIAFERNDIVIWDQTNLTVKSRAKKLAMVPSHYKKIAVVLEVPLNLEQRLSNRYGKTIPDHVMENMKRSFQYPTVEEGFEIIQNIA